MQECLGGVAIGIFDDAEHEAKESKAAKGNGVEQAGVGHDVHGIGDQHCGAAHVHGAVEKAHGVFLQHRAMVAAGVLKELFFSDTLAEAEKDGEQEYGQKEPVGYGHTKGDTAGVQPQEKAGGDAEDVHHRNVLQFEAVSGREKKIAEQGDEKGDGDEHPETECRGKKAEAEKYGTSSADGAGGDGPTFFDWMAGVFVRIQHVVDSVIGAGSEAEREEWKGQIAEDFRLKEYPPEQRREEEHQIFEPLLGPE